MLVFYTVSHLLLIIKGLLSTKKKSKTSKPQTASVGNSELFHLLTLPFFNSLQAIVLVSGNNSPNFPFFKNRNCCVLVKLSVWGRRIAKPRIFHICFSSHGTTGSSWFNKYIAHKSDFFTPLSPPPKPNGLGMTKGRRKRHEKVFQNLLYHYNGNVCITVGQCGRVSNLAVLWVVVTAVSRELSCCCFSVPYGHICSQLILRLSYIHRVYSVPVI